MSVPFYGRKAELTPLQAQAIKTYLESGIVNPKADRRVKTLLGNNPYCIPKTRGHIDRVFMLFEKALKGEHYNDFWRGHC